MKRETTRLAVHIQSGASRNEVTGYSDNILKVRIAAPPVEGKANEKLVEFLSDVLNVARSSIVIKSGLTGKHKILEISTLSPEGLATRLKRLIK